MNQRPGNEMRTTNRNFGLAWSILLLMATAAAAQTDVTTINGGNPGTVPVFTTNTHNIENSVITQSGSNVGIGMGTTAPATALQVNGSVTAGATVSNVPNALNVLQYGAKGDGVQATMTTSTSAGVTTVTCSLCNFTAADQSKTINIPGAGALILNGGTLGTPTVTINTNGIVTAVTFAGYSGLPVNATIPVTFSAPTIAAPLGVTATGYVTTDASGTPTAHIWVAGENYQSAPTISVGIVKDGTNVLPYGPLKTTIATVVSASKITLTAAATNDIVTGVSAYYGTDNTTAIQNSLNALLSQTQNGNRNVGYQLYFPSGFYLISNSLSVNSGTGAIPIGWQIAGESQGSTRLVQLMDNTPIFDLNQAGQWGFHIHDLSFDYANYQVPVNTKASSIFLDAASNFFEFELDRLTFYGGMRGISSNQSLSELPWGYKIHNIRGQDQLSGAVINLVVSSPAGEPRCQLEQIYTTTTIGEPEITLGGTCIATLVHELEADNAYNTVYSFSLSASTATIDGVHLELYHPATTGSSSVTVDGAYATVSNILENSIPPVIGSPITYFLVRNNPNGAGSLTVSNAVVDVGPCRTQDGGGSTCSIGTPPSHAPFIAFTSVYGANSIDGAILVSPSATINSQSGNLQVGSNVAHAGSIIRQGLAISDGRYVIPDSSLLTLDTRKGSYQEYYMQRNVSSSNLSILPGWTGAHLRLRLIQAPQGLGPFTATSSNIALIAPPAVTTQIGSGSGASCTATMNVAGTAVTAVTCTGGTGYPASIKIPLQFYGATFTQPAEGYIPTDASGNLTGSGTITFAGAGYSGTPSVGVGETWSEQNYVWQDDIQQWVASGPATFNNGTASLSAGTIATTQSAGDNSTKVATTAYVDSKVIVLPASLTTTAATSDNVSITGMTSTGHCSLTPTNSSAATDYGGGTVYVSAKASGSVTVTHSSTASETFDLICTTN
jgi:hypothetical protein